MTEFWEKCVIMNLTKNGRKKDSQRVLRCSEHHSTAFPNRARENTYCKSYMNYNTSFECSDAFSLNVTNWV